MKDAGLRVADLLGARITPEAFLVDGEGRLRDRGQVRSKIGRPHLEEAIRAVLSGSPVPTPEPRAFGCAIER